MLWGRTRTLIGVPGARQSGRRNEMGSCKEGVRRVKKVDLIQRMMSTKTTEINMHIISCESISFIAAL